jgi:poly-gamma-glutamate synthesis protein (capsule biosynthesis protein)
VSTVWEEEEIMLNRVIRIAVLITLILSLNAAAQEEKITLVAVGDIMLAHRLKPFIEEHGPSYPYKYTACIFKEADISFANLESPLSTEGKPVPDKEYTFRAHPKAAEGLKDVGFDVLSLANNHILDYGEGALFETIEVLDNRMIFHIGAGKNIFEAREPVILKVKNKKFGFLAYSNTFPKRFWAEEDKTGTAYGKFSSVKKDVKELKEKVDFLIVSFHWGNEEEISPQEYQRNLAHLAIDQGADIILGHHPHTLSGIETYRNGIIIYSLGNFAFGSYSEKAKESAIFRFYFSKDKLQKLEIIPISVYNKKVKFQPRILKKERAERVLEKIRKLSNEFNTKIKTKNSKGTITF